MNLTSRGGQTGVAYAPDGTRFLNKRSGKIFTHVVVTKHKNFKNYGWFKWCESLEEAILCKEVDVWKSEASWGFTDVAIVDCKMVHPWEISD